MSEKVMTPKNIEVKVEMVQDGVTSEMTIICQIEDGKAYSVQQSVRCKNNANLKLLHLTNDIEAYNVQVEKHKKGWSDLVTPFIPLNCLPYITRYTEANSFLTFPHGQEWIEVSPVETSTDLVVTD